jgi:hypothetical protein
MRKLVCRDGTVRQPNDSQHIEAISESMRELIEDLWPELVNKLPPKAN